jgi:hypothetical protein
MIISTCPYASRPRCFLFEEEDEDADCWLWEKRPVELLLSPVLRPGWNQPSTIDVEGIT